MFNFNNMIHEERSKCLRDIPKVSGTVLSAGCSGAWYFDWFMECTGHSGKHIGLELYSQKPDDLPSNITWIANSVGNMTDVNTESIDTLFSGQNIEHLSSDDMASFLCEASRVLKKDGLLIIDSPNRSVTQHLGYIQPEHTLELTVDEISMLLYAAGFYIDDVRGIWLVIDPKTGKRMDIFSCDEHCMPFHDRINNAHKNPNLSFIWFITARKFKVANKALVSDITTNIFWKNYSPFVASRFAYGVGKIFNSYGSQYIEIDKNHTGCALYGPYIPLAEGTYTALFFIRLGKRDHDDAVVSLDVVSSLGAVSHGKIVLNMSRNNLDMTWQQYSINFSLDGYTTGIETRVFVKNFSGQIIKDVKIMPII